MRAGSLEDDPGGGPRSRRGRRRGDRREPWPAGRHSGSCGNRFRTRSARKAPRSSTTFRCPSRRSRNSSRAPPRRWPRSSPAARIVCFGHMGDGNLHYNISQPAGGDGAAFLALYRPMNKAVHDVVRALGGSISAEHGIGQLKRDELLATAPPVAHRPDAPHQGGLRSGRHHESGQGDLERGSAGASSPATRRSVRRG